MNLFFNNSLAFDNISATECRLQALPEHVNVQ